MGVVLMSKRELNRIDVLARLDGRRLTASAAGDLMRVTLRQTPPVLEAYRGGGAARWRSADGLGSGRSDAGHTAADPSVVEAIPRWRCACDCEPAAWSAIEH